MYYKILYLPTATYLQSLVNMKNPRFGTIDTIFSTKEEAVDRLHCKLVYESSLNDIDNPIFLFSHFNIEEYEGELPVQYINNIIRSNQPIQKSDWCGDNTGNLGLY